ncbi:VanZ like family protein [Aquisphaera giovannonii]|uniref:VanZ like family protein n=1 Tax=Aquisphaera giovannonii TaxID=406548 RepID=A0A5B9W015_9BACT|nr:VanZ family protein [Aquisphaera giovannonii]QEH33250.1 VanZ like family protein [Aquisphaera giovannonii]
MKRIGLVFVAFASFLVSVVAAADAGLGPSLWGWVERVPFGDKMCHCVLMFTLCLLANLALGSRELHPGRGPFLLATVVVGCLVLAEEISQIWIPGRTFDLLDLSADAIGLLAADLGARGLRARLRPSIRLADRGEAA